MPSATPFPFDFRARTPDRPLRRFVESIWYARGTVPYARERVAPTGSTVAILILGDPIVQTADDGRADPVRSDTGLLIGPHDGPIWNEPLGETFAVGVVTTPIGCEVTVRLSPADLRGRVVPLLEVWPSAAGLRDELTRMTAPEAMLDRLAHHLQQNLRVDLPGLERVERAVRLLEHEPTRSIADIAEQLGISHGYLDRECLRRVGLSPRVLARLLRMRKLLAQIDIYGAVGWADRAAELGWYDQAHLVRDFKRHTGVTPSAYLAAQRATFTPTEPGEGAGFVPEVKNIQES